MSTTAILEQIKQALKLTRDVELTRLTSGTINHVYRISNLSEGREWGKAFTDVVVKWFGEDKFSGVDRCHQFNLQQQLCERGIATKPLWLSDDECVWVEQWQPSKQVNSVTPSDLASVLAQIHRLTITTRPLNLAKRWQHYAEVCGLSPSDALYTQVQSLRKAVTDSEREVKDSVLCHNDLLAGHVLFQEDDKPVVIDWEYAAMGNRYFDLASCCLINQFDEKASAQLIETYCAIMGIALDEAKEKFSQHVNIVSTTNALWLEALAVSKLTS
ncbi:hypothetical protein D210916BOD24_21950 [Alteromonas sp. D210916BOD_24]|uniref:phosphotransferase n=1 Tax=Alteromonas sp. D210916BOD_24 TaxID=3157618 RepID=UPI00399C923C